jgi:predicted pyridoxine 5'-phosphate oxidase superfamily flavin-nucleotide-binding protein
MADGEEQPFAFEFTEVVSTEAQFREVIGHPSHRVLRKQIDHLDGHARAFIAKCPFLLISSCDGEGRMDQLPEFALVVDVREAFFHCAKCVIRSKLWDQGAWPELGGLPSLARAMVDWGQLRREPRRDAGAYREGRS